VYFFKISSKLLKTLLMNQKSLLSLAFGLLMCTSGAFSRDVNPSYCNGITGSTWDEASAKATFKKIPTNCNKAWSAYALDGTWSNWSEVAFTFTPGDSVITTSRVVPTGPYWKPSSTVWPGGAASVTKPGFVALCLWSPTNTDTKNQDCTVQVSPSHYTPTPTPTYCDNFRAYVTKDRKTIVMTGLNNHTPNDWFAYTDDGWVSYADVTPILKVGQDTAFVDMSTVIYAAGPKKGEHVQTPITGSLSMIADATGVNKCTADNQGGNNKNGIDMTSCPIWGGGTTPQPEKPIYCDNYRAAISADGKTIYMTGLNNHTPNSWFGYTDDAWASFVDLTASVSAGKDSAIIDMSKQMYAYGPKAGNYVSTPLTGTLVMAADVKGPGQCIADNQGGNNKSGIDMTTCPVWNNGGRDTQAPSTPEGIYGSLITSSSFYVNWNPCYDNVGVMGYEVYVDGMYYTTTYTNGCQLSGLLPNSCHQIALYALDAAGNRSGINSSTICTSNSEPTPSCGNISVTWEPGKKCVDPNFCTGNAYKPHFTISGVYGVSKLGISKSYDGYNIDPVMYLSNYDQNEVTIFESVSNARYIYVTVNSNTDDACGTRFDFTNCYGDKYCAPSIRTEIATTNVTAVSVFPNPASKSETVSVQGEFENDITINVYDLSGSLVLTQTKTAVDHSTQLNLSDLNIKSGMYIIKVVNAEKTLVGKLIIQ
jgi:hypothetical protein